MLSFYIHKTRLVLSSSFDGCNSGGRPQDPQPGVLFLSPLPPLGVRVGVGGAGMEKPGLKHCPRNREESHDSEERREKCIYIRLVVYWASLRAQLVKNPPAMQETPVRFLDWEDPLEKG